LLEVADGEDAEKELYLFNHNYRPRLMYFAWHSLGPITTQKGLISLGTPELLSVLTPM
jgi:hypothetical protein